MILNMNTIPKLNIKVIDLKNDIDIKNYFLNKKYRMKNKVYWNDCNEIELAGFDFLISSDFKNQDEYEELSNYYRKIVESNEHIFNDLTIPFIFIGSAFDF